MGSTKTTEADRRDRSALERGVRRPQTEVSRQAALRGIATAVRMLEGATYKEAGDAIGVGVERARQLAVKTFRQAARSKHWGDAAMPDSLHLLPDVRAHRDHMLKVLRRMADDLAA